LVGENDADSGAKNCVVAKQLMNIVLIRGGAATMIIET
jgi:hypothetical protein